MAEGVRSMTGASPAGDRAVAASIPSVTQGSGTVFYIPLDLATTPASGECIAGNWWAIHPQHGVAFYAQLLGYLASEAPSPQCNQSEGTARLLSRRLYPDHEVRVLPAVFVRHAERAMATLRAQAIAGDAPETTPPSQESTGQ